MAGRAPAVRALVRRPPWLGPRGAAMPAPAPQGPPPRRPTGLRTRRVGRQGAPVGDRRCRPLSGRLPRRTPLTRRGYCAPQPHVGISTQHTWRSLSGLPEDSSKFRTLFEKCGSPDNREVATGHVNTCHETSPIPTSKGHIRLCGSPCDRLACDVSFARSCLVLRVAPNCVRGIDAVHRLSIIQIARYVDRRSILRTC